jgi:hypothetical protein
MLVTINDYTMMPFIKKIKNLGVRDIVIVFIAMVIS